MSGIISLVRAPRPSAAFHAASGPPPPLPGGTRRGEVSAASWLRGRRAVVPVPVPVRRCSVVWGACSACLCCALASGYRSPSAWARYSAGRSPVAWAARPAGRWRAAWGTGAPGRLAFPRPGRFRRSAGRARAGLGRTRGRLTACGRRADDDVGELLGRRGEHLGVGGGGECAETEHRGRGGHGGGGAGRQECEERPRSPAACPGGWAGHAGLVPVRGQRRGLARQFVVGWPRRQRRQDLRHRPHLRRRAAGNSAHLSRAARDGSSVTGSSLCVGHGRFGMSSSGTPRPVTALHRPRPESPPAAAGPGGRPP